MANTTSIAWGVRDGGFDFEVTVPPNTTATVVLPAADADALTESGRPLDPAERVQIRRWSGNGATLSVTAGTYKFTTRLP